MIERHQLWASAPTQCSYQVGHRSDHYHVQVVGGDSARRDARSSTPDGRASLSSKSHSRSVVTPPATAATGRPRMSAWNAAVSLHAGTTARPRAPSRGHATLRAHNARKASMIYRLYQIMRSPQPGVGLHSRPGLRADALRFSQQLSLESLVVE